MAGFRTGGGSTGFRIGGAPSGGFRTGPSGGFRTGGRPAREEEDGGGGGWGHFEHLGPIPIPVVRFGVFPGGWNPLASAAAASDIPGLKQTGRVVGGMAYSPYEVVRHPWNATREGYGVVIGGIEIPAAIAQMRTGKEMGLFEGPGLFDLIRGHEGGMSWKEIGSLFAGSVINDYKTRYGADWKEQAADRPLSNLFDLLTVVGVGARAAALGGAANRLKAAGMTRSARRLWQESSRPGIHVADEPYKRRIEFQPETGRLEPAYQPYSRSPLRRATQTMVDNLAQGKAGQTGIPGLDGLVNKLAGELPKTPLFGARARVTRANAAQMTRSLNRFLGVAAHTPALQSLSKADLTRLVWGAQLGDHSPGMLRAFREILDDEYNLPLEDTIPDPEFRDWLKRAKQQGFGPTLLKNLDIAIEAAEKSPTPDTWSPKYQRALTAMQEITHLSEETIRDADGFTNLRNDLTRARDRVNLLGPDHEDTPALLEEIERIKQQIKDKETQLTELFRGRRGRVRSWVDRQPVRRSKERAAWEQELARRGWDPEVIAEALRIGDIRARIANPHDPRAYWRDRIGMPSDETAETSRARNAAVLEQRQTRTIDELEQDLRGGLERLPDQETLRDIAFDGVDTDVFRGHNIDDFLEKIPEYLQRGAPYRFWYEDSAKAILRYAGGDRELAARVAQVVAIYSASRNPRENINLAMQALREWQETGKITVAAVSKEKKKGLDQADKANMVMRGEDWGGRKTNRFYANMLEDIDPERYAKEFPGGEVTNDIWMARLFGLKSDVPTPREYEQMAKIQQNIADALGWKPKQIQAALWVPAKADAGRTVTGPGGTKIRVPLPDDEAGIDFARALDEESATASIEAAPGRRAAPELHGRYRALSPEDRAAYTSEKRDAIADFMREAGVFGEVSAEGVGIWENAANPAFTITLPIGGARLITEAGKKTPVSWVGAEGRRHMTAVMSIAGEALNQDAMAWFRPFYRREPITKQNGAWLQLSRPLSEAETLALYRGMRERLGGEVVLPPAPDGDLFALNFSGAKHDDFHAALEEVLEAVTDPENPLDVEAVPFRFDGDYRTRSQYSAAARAAAPEGVQLPPSRGFAGRPDVREAARRLSDRSRDIDERYLGEAGPPRAAEPVAQTRVRYQRPDFADLPKGATEFLADGRTAIRMFEGGDLSTWIHELGHIALHDLNDEDFATLAREFASGKPKEAWTTEENEDFARAFERYFVDGIAPSRELKPIFDKISRWIKTIWDEEKLNVPEISDDVRNVFHNLLAAHEPDVFVPHRAGEANLTGARTSRGIPRAGRALGDWTAPRIPMFKRNNLALLRGGLINDDPRLLVEHMNRVIMLAKANQLREAVLQMGEPLRPGIQPDFDTQYVVKKFGRGVDDATYDALERVDDPGQVRRSIEKFVDENITDDPDKFGEWDAWKGEDQLYVVDKQTVDQLFKHMTGRTPGAPTKPRSAGGAAVDAVLDTVRGLLLFANPGFYVANILGNSFMAGVMNPSSYKYITWSMNEARKAAIKEDTADPLWHRISIEMGRGPTAGGLSQRPTVLGRPGTQIRRAVRHPRETAKAIREAPPGKFGRGAESISNTWMSWGRRSGHIIDDTFRVAAWRATAAKHGVKTEEQIEQLFKDATVSTRDMMRTDQKTPQGRAVRKLNSIRDEAEQLMLDFDSMTPFERTWLTRAIFLYPFLKASAKYPVMFAGERPITTGVTGGLALAGGQIATAPEAFGERPELPTWMQGAARIGPDTYVPAGSLAPYAPALGILESIAAIGRKPELGISTPFEYLNPATQLMVQLMQGRTGFGTAAAGPEILRGEAPLPAYLRYPWKKPSKVYAERDWWNTLLRAFRGPYQVNASEVQK